MPLNKQQALYYDATDNSCPFGSKTVVTAFRRYSPGLKQSPLEDTVTSNGVLKRRFCRSWSLSRYGTNCRWTAAFTFTTTCSTMEPQTASLPHWFIVALTVLAALLFTCEFYLLHLMTNLLRKARNSVRAMCHNADNSKGFMWNSYFRIICTAIYDTSCLSCLCSCVFCLSLYSYLINNWPLGC